MGTRLDSGTIIPGLTLSSYAYAYAWSWRFS
jgi:hypothetical protein